MCISDALGLFLLSDSKQILKWWKTKLTFSYWVTQSISQRMLNDLPFFKKLDESGQSNIEKQFNQDVYFLWKFGITNTLKTPILYQVNKKCCWKRSSSVRQYVSLTNKVTVSGQIKVQHTYFWLPVKALQDLPLRSPFFTPSLIFHAKLILGNP